MRKIHVSHRPPYPQPPIFVDCGQQTVSPLPPRVTAEQTHTVSDVTNTTPQNHSKYIINLNNERNYAIKLVCSLTFVTDNSDSRGCKIINIDTQQQMVL